MGFGALGFLRDSRRMNVLLSRAKSKLVLITSLRFLSEAVNGANSEQQQELAFVRRLLASIEELQGRSAPDGVHLATVIDGNRLEGRP